MAHRNGNDRFARLLGRVRDVILLGLGTGIIVREVATGDPNLVSIAVGVLFAGGPGALAALGWGSAKERQREE